MKPVHESAASRHLEDTERLCAQQRWDNAMYLAGYVVECAIKAVIDRAGLRLKMHVDQMSSAVLVLAADLSLAARRYAIDLDSDVAFVRDTWKHQYRYVRTGTVTQRQAEDLKEAARRVYGRSIEAMVLDGYLERVPQ